MKKSLRLLLVMAAAAMMVTAGVAFAGCDKVLDHDHIFGEWTILTPATCTEDGLQKHSCIDPNCSFEETLPLNAPGHSYDNGVFTSTDCTQGGVMLRTCTVCGNTNDEIKAEPREHEFEVKQVITAATCKQEGQSVFVCKGCGKEETRTVEKTPHTFGEPLENKPATCKAEGYIKKQCTECGEIVEEHPAKLDHNWAPKGSERKATCTTEGVKTLVCTNCGKEDTIKTPPLQHDYEINITKYPTFQEEGSRTVKCKRGDDEHTEVLPKLVDGQKIEFQVQLFRNNGLKYTGTSLKISIMNGDKVLASGQYGSITGGLLKAEIEIHENQKYTVKVENLPKGYTAPENVEISPADPYAAIYLTGSVRAANDVPGSLSVGTAVNDFTYKTIDGKELKLSELLKTHDFVYIDIFFIHCTWCDVTFKAMNLLHENWKDKIAFIAIGDKRHSQNPNAEAVKNYRDELGMVYDVVYDGGQPLGTSASGIEQYIADVANVTGYPFAFVIDKEGVVAARHNGAYSSSQDPKIAAEEMEKYLNQLVSQYTIKSGEKKDGLAISMLRGDYLPVFGDEQ